MPVSDASMQLLLLVMHADAPLTWHAPLRPCAPQMSTATGDRRTNLKSTRSLLYQIPLNELFELPGRPHVVYQLRSYAGHANEEEAAMHARNDVPFLFKAFETGQIGPKRMAKMHGGKARVFTIHEYLNWTVTAQSTDADDELVGTVQG